MITVRTINNNLEQRIVTAPQEVPATGRALAQLAPLGARGCVVNDRMILSSDADWAAYSPRDGDTLTFIMAPAGIEVGAVLIAAALFVGKVALGAIASFAINSLISKLLSPTTSLANVGPKSKKDSPAYGFEQIQNGRDPRAAVPLLFGGPHDVGGHIIAAWRSVAAKKGKGKKGGGSQFIHFIQVISEGPIEAIGQYTTAQDGLTEPEDFPEGIKVNDLPLEKLKDITISLRLGADDQTVMPGFEAVNNEYGNLHRLKDGDSEFTWETKDPVHALGFQLEFPGGLFKIGDTGDNETIDVELNVKLYDMETETLFFETPLIIKANRASRHWYEYRKDNLPFAHYRLVVVRTDESGEAANNPQKNDATDVIAVNEIQYAALSYPGLALMGVKIRASEQLQGGFPRVTVPCKGIKVATGFGTGWTNNPAEIIHGILVDKNWGLGRLVDAADIDATTLEEFRDWCDEEIPIFTDSEVLEKRAELDIILDSPRGAWEVLQALASTARGNLLKLGSLIKFKIERPALATQLFTAGSVLRGSAAVQHISRRSRPTRISVNFRDRDNLFKQDSQSAEFAFVDESLGELNARDMDMWGIIRRTQAARLAWYLLRHEQLVGKRIKFEVPLQAIVCEPGDVVNVALETSRNGISGRLARVSDTGNAVMDRAFSFVQGVVYTYREVNTATGEILTQDFSHEGEGLFELPFAPLHGGETATGREYSVGEKYIDVTPWRIHEIRTAGDSLTREITGVQYVGEVYSDDAEPSQRGFIDIETPEEVPTATGLVVTLEESVEAGLSLITIDWTTAGLGISYQVYVRPSPGDGTVGGEIPVATTALTIATFESAEIYDRNIDIIIQSIETLTGRRSNIEDSPYITYKIRRETDGTDILTVPGPVENLGWTDLLDPDGNVYSLDWDAVAGADGYEVRVGSWASGRVVYRGASNSATLRLHALARRYYVRAYVGTEYSTDEAAIDSPEVDYAAYTSEADGAALDLAALAVNAVALELFGESHVTQLDDAIPITAQSAVIDLTSSAATHVCLDTIIRPRIVKTAEALGIPADSVRWSAFGKINETYQAWTLMIRWKVAGGDEWTEVAYTDAAAGENIVLTARYFQFAFSGETLAVPRDGEAALLEKMSKVLMTRIAYSLRRA